LEHIPNKFAKKTYIGFPSCSDSQAALMLKAGNFISTNQMNTFVVAIPPKKIVGCLINVVTNTLRESSNLHIIGMDGRKDR